MGLLGKVLVTTDLLPLINYTRKKLTSSRSFITVPNAKDSNYLTIWCQT